MDIGRQAFGLLCYQIVTKSLPKCYIISSYHICMYRTCSSDWSFQTCQSLSLYLIRIQMAIEHTPKNNIVAISIDLLYSRNLKNISNWRKSEYLLVMYDAEIEQKKLLLAVSTHAIKKNNWQCQHFIFDWHRLFIFSNRNQFLGECLDKHHCHILDIQTFHFPFLFLLTYNRNSCPKFF